ncbi:MAG TPA: hypothetical protein VM890_05805, partial [Longimicrobium sp.]|nr:hypothetical protein [Longimicrobium sp.]
LVVPTVDGAAPSAGAGAHDAAAWRASIVGGLPDAVAPPFGALGALLARDAAERRGPAWGEALRRTVDGVAGLTAIDGATIVDRAFTVLAFGAKITPRRGSAPVDRVLATEPVAGSTAEVVAPSQLGGTRHLSAAQFVHDQRDALAMVASQDGRFTVFAWSPCEGMVHAHRVETLLM